MNKKILIDENKHFQKLKQIISNIIESNKTTIQNNEKEISKIREYMLDNIELDMELGDIDFDALRNGDLIQTLNDNKNLLEVKNYKLKQIQNSPFFGRFDIKDNYGEEKFYIGLQNVKDVKIIYIVDWRAPICSLFYNSSIGQTSYNVKNKLISTNLILKRQFEINESKITNYYDTNNNLNDIYLNKILQNNTSNYMSNIVKSIQQEQNDIIRLPLNNSVILQGVAGSGKTSIAMHRIAYLLYSNETLNNDNIIFISPSSLFTGYISHLLPELGEENVFCYSFFDVLQENKLLNFKPTKRLELLEEIQKNNLILHKQISKIFSPQYFESLCDFLSNQISIQDFQILFPTLSNQLVKKLFFVGEDSYFLNKRIKFIAERFANYLGYKKTKTNILTKKILKYFENKLNIENLFEKFMLLHNLEPNKILNQNISSYIFIKMCIEGFNVDKTIKHIVIDEMQDYDFITYKILSMIYPNATFTILGDIYQNLLTESQNYLNFLQKIIPNSEIKKIEISYRSTSNIFNYANKILGEKPSSKIIRKGENPEEI